MKLQFLRRFFYAIHIWLGIVSGVIVSIICLSGSLLVFRGEIMLFTDTGKYYVCVPAEKQRVPVDEIITKLETKNPEMKVISITIHEKTNRTMELTLLSQPVPNEKRRSQRYYVNPYTGDVVANGDDGVQLGWFFSSITQLHRYLWMSSYRIEFLNISLGRLIVGTSTIVFIIVSLSGFVLWLPRTWKNFLKWKAWKHGFKIRFRHGFWCLIHDFHKTVGFYLLIPILILALTGLCWSFKWYRDFAGYAIGTPIFKGGVPRAKIEPVDDSMQPYSLDKIIEHTQKLLPATKERIIFIPNNREETLMIRNSSSGFFVGNIGANNIQWDRFRGTIVPVEHFGKTVEIERFVDKPFGAKIASSIHALHFGAITGTSSKIFFFFACLFATTLPITGVIIWIRKLYLKRKIRLRKK
jgi:uncharacterized iron-regulated membrane protein